MKRAVLTYLLLYSVMSQAQNEIHNYRDDYYASISFKVYDIFVQHLEWNDYVNDSNSIYLYSQLYLEKSEDILGINAIRLKDPVSECSSVDNLKIPSGSYVANVTLNELGVHYYVYSFEVFISDNGKLRKISYERFINTSIEGEEKGSSHLRTIERKVY